jgi:parallel beta-helix repeat protein
MTIVHPRAAAAAAILAGALALAAPAAAKPALQCGDTVTHSVTLTRDLTNCPDKGLVIGADGITVDLNGHTIDGTVTQLTDCDAPPFGPAGISNPGYDRVTIKNGTLQQFFAGFGAGTETTGMSNSTLRDLTARDNRFSGITMGSRYGHNDDDRIVHNHVYGNGCGDGIGLNTSARTLVAHNRSHDNGGGISVCCSQDDVVRDNVVTRNAENGITICCDGRKNLIEGNEVTDNANNGIQVFFNADGTLIRGNHVARNGDDIVLDGGANDTTVAHNLVTDALGCPFCDPPTGFGILVVEDANDNVIAENIVARTKEDGIRILDFDPADPENPVPTGTTLRGNLVSHAGHDGIRTDSAAAILTRNAAYFNHDLGIEAVPGVTDGGGNRARHNGNPAQCVGVSCH